MEIISERKKGRKVSAHVRRFLDLAEQHYTRHCTVQEYARMVGISYCHLIRLCKKDTGRPPLAHVHEIITHKAKDLLADGYTVKEVAITLGYTDLANFNHFFKANTGESPTSYRSIIDK